MPEPRVTIKIPRPLYERILKSIEGSGFSSATDFIVYVLRDVMSGAGDKSQEAELTREELEAIKQRLKNLGYL
ncbi:MAG: CopG family transcriptional regulator [Candidatus Eisenbacteria bacterium]